MHLGEYSRLSLFARRTDHWTGAQAGAMLDRTPSESWCLSFGMKPFTFGIVHISNTDNNRMPLICIGRPWQKYRCGKTGKWAKLERRAGEWAHA